jgi:hypothetical protein
VDRRARRRRERRERRARSREGARRGSPALRALTSAALALPGMAQRAQADAPIDRASADYRFSFYEEDAIPSGRLAGGSQGERYEIEVHQLETEMPVGDRAELRLDLSWEKMSGATPWFVVPGDDDEPLQVMSGATIEDQRTDILAEGRYHFDASRASLNGGVSFEDDYLSFNVGLGGERDLFDKHTTLSGGLGVSYDQIDPVSVQGQPARASDDKLSASLFTGVSQVVNRNAQIQATVTYKYSDGFLSDPYKLASVAGVNVADSRPDSRHQVAILARFRQHVPVLDASLHLDYRYYIDSWDIQSHTLELAWYQTLFRRIRVIPSARYYSQSQADFYAPFYTTARSDGFASSDYRLSPYGALSWGIRAELEFSSWFQWDWLLSAGYERYASGGDLALGDVKVENPGLVDYQLFSVGLKGRF